jgi:hypothetical protein
MSDGFSDQAAWQHFRSGSLPVQESNNRSLFNTPTPDSDRPPSASLLKNEPTCDGVPWWTTCGGWVGDPSMCPVLEIRIDQCTSPVTICLTGILDTTTEGTFLRVMDELLAEGVQHLMIDAGAAEVGDASGASALTKLQRRTREVGGSLTWEGVDLNEPRCRVPMAFPLSRNRTYM